MRRSALSLTTALCLCSAAALAQEPAPEGSSLTKTFPGKSYSPYAQRGIPDRPLWGDTHLHTSTSFDAGAFGTRLDAREAYRFAKGEEVQASTGFMARLSRPLDFLVVADHSDNMGLFDLIFAQDPSIMTDPEGNRIATMVANGGDEGVAAALELIDAYARGEAISPALAIEAGSKSFRSVWQRQIEAAEEAYEPGLFTSFIGYEWTSLIQGANMHRVVIYRDGGDKAGMLDPFTTEGTAGSTNPRDLWDWMANYEKVTRGDVLAIAHNGNLSNGIMFPETAQYNGAQLDAEYVEARARWEPMYEATQMKGDGEAHPFLSPNDEFADYETWDLANLNGSELKEDYMLQYEYAREALKTGLKLEARLGTNPYKFGMVGSTDSHTSLATAQEDNFFGKHSGAEPNPQRPTHAVAEFGDQKLLGWEMVASGLAAVWAAENTREAIFDAMERKEVYATTGSRVSVRFFGGWDYSMEDLTSRMPASAGYAKGTPMGGNLSDAPEGAAAPTFMVYALKDPIGGNLDRIQIVKGWMDAEGETHEQVYDVVWAGDREPDSDGKLPPIGSTVDVERATWTNTIGQGEMGTVWTDPDFDPAQPAFYYARVIEIPTPRWTAYDAFRMGAEVPAESPMETQERAYTSPIWYTP
jgi:endonuclease YncB( thermonuclease family)